MSKVGHFIIDVERIVEEDYSDQYVVTLSGDTQYKTEAHTMLTTALDVIRDFILAQVWKHEDAKDAAEAPKDDGSERTP